MEVSLIDFNKESAVNKVWVACRTCYSEKSPQELIEEARTLPEKKKVSLIESVLQMNHISTIEHIDFTFALSGISRSAAMQFLRHRHQSPSMQSQRYCSFKSGFDYVIPKTVQANVEALEGYNLAMKALTDVYKIFLNIGIPAEDARYVLPNAAKTNLTVTLNLRELIHIAHERMCTSAQWEIRELTNNMVSLVTKDLPFLKKYLTPKCEWLGYCTESEKKTCHRKPLKNEIV